MRTTQAEQTAALPPLAASLSPRTAGALRLGYAGFAGWQAAVALVLFAAAMTSGINYDEDQYIAAGAMARHARLYADFIHLQPPFYPLVLSVVFGFVEGHHLLAGRLLTWLLSMASFSLLFSLLLRLGAGRGLAALLVTACIASPFLLGPVSNTRNDILPLCLLLGGLALYLRADGQAPWRRSMLLAAGFCIGLATATKLSYAFAPAVAVLHVALPRAGSTNPGSGPEWMAGLLPLALGIGLALSPCLWYLALAPEGFRFGLVEYHLAAPIAWYREAGEPELLSVAGRLKFLAVLLLLGGNGTLVGLAVAFTAMRRSKAAGSNEGRAAALVLGMLAGALLMGFLPRPSWPMYYAPVAPLLACWIAVQHGRLLAAGAACPSLPILALSLLPALPVSGPLLAGLAKLPAFEAWPGVAVRRNAVAIRDLVAAAGLEGDVATLFPIHVLDANRVRAEFASGPFVFRSAGLSPPDRLARLRGAGPSDLDRLFAAEPPAAIFGGVYADRWGAPMDAALLEYAERHGYALALRDIAAGGAVGGRLYLRPSMPPLPAGALPSRP